MIVLAASMLGAALWALVMAGWLSFDLLAGTQTITEDRALGIGIALQVLCQIGWVAIIAYEESRP